MAMSNFTLPDTLYITSTTIMTSSTVHQQLLEEEEKGNRIRGVIGTVVFHALLLLLIWQLAFTNNPPLPEEAGIPVDFGTSNIGSGDIIPTTAEPIAANNTPTPPQPQATAASSPEDNNVITQTNEDAPEVKTNPDKKKEIKPTPIVTKDVPKTPAKDVPKDVPKPPVPKPEQKGATMGKHTGTNNPGNNGNDAPGTPGDKGVPWGSQSNTNYDGPDGTGDTPGGNKGGKMPVDYYLKGRYPLVKPKFKNYIQETGIVVITIGVDRNGTVVSTDCCSAKGTTTKSQALINKALEEGKTVKFNPNPDAAEIQYGTYTFIFKLE